MGTGSDECIFLTCEVAWLVAGALLAVLYVRIIFGPGHGAGDPPQYCAINVEPRGWKVRVRQGSIYVYDYRVHHWLVYTALLPLSIWLQAYFAIGWSLVLIVHGLWFDDRFVFHYSSQGNYEQATEGTHGEIATLQGPGETDGEIGAQGKSRQMHDLGDEGAFVISDED